VHLSRIDLNLLVVLDAIYTEGGITRAAEKLHLTQPAISHALGRLRRLLNDELFEREGRAMVPTPFARNLIGPLRRSLRSLELTLNEIESFDPAKSRKRFALGVRDVLEATVLPPLMEDIGESAPGIEIAAMQVDRREMESELASGTLDAALDVLLPVSDAVRHARIIGDRMMVVARKNHPTVRHRLTLEQYLKHDHILVSSRRSGPGLEDVELSRIGVQRNVRLRCQHYFAACRVVSQTNFLLTMPERYARVANEHFGNRILSFPLEKPTLDVHMYWHSNVENEPANKWLRKQLRRTFER
jgi:DNA-binding transcriptional LysR family regulator